MNRAIPIPATPSPIGPLYLQWGVIGPQGTLPIAGTTFATTRARALVVF